MKKQILTNIITVEGAIEYLFEQEVATTKRLFFDNDMTAREVCKAMGLEKFYSSNMQKHFFRRIGAKGKGHGGKRPGSGNKKGIKFCGKCRQQIEKCKCK